MPPSRKPKGTAPTAKMADPREMWNIEKNINGKNNIIFAVRDVEKAIKKSAQESGARKIGLYWPGTI